MRVWVGAPGGKRESTPNQTVDGRLRYSWDRLTDMDMGADSGGRAEKRRCEELRMERRKMMGRAEDMDK